MGKRFTLNVKSFPGTLPVFPLNNTLLLPAGQLPLNIFEPRYLDMIDDALGSPDRLIGMVLTKEAGRITRGTPVFEVGCAGRITSFTERPDGRLFVTLTGICRFILKQEMDTLSKYRRAAVDWAPYANDLFIDPEVPIDRERFLKVFKKYAEHMKVEFDPDYLEKIPNYNLVTFFSMNLPFRIIDRQALMEAPTLEDRADTLIALIEMELNERNPGEAPPEQ